MTVSRIAIAAATLLLAGCGTRGPTGLPAGGAGPTSQVGLPPGYRAGAGIGGMEGTPSLRAASFPRFTVTAAGVKSDPVNMLVAGSEGQVRQIFGLAGWLEADPTTAWTAAKTVKAMLVNGSYPTSPMSDLYLYNRVQDMSYQKNAISVKARDHLRVWRTPLKDRLGRPFWAIAATRDVAVKFGPGETLPTHQISPDIDAERQLVVSDFLRSRQVGLRYPLQSLPRGYRGVNGGGDEYFTDGRVEVLELKPETAVG